MANVSFPSPFQRTFNEGLDASLVLTKDEFCEYIANKLLTKGYPYTHQILAVGDKVYQILDITGITAKSSSETSDDYIESLETDKKILRLLDKTDLNGIAGSVGSVFTYRGTITAFSGIPTGAKIGWAYRANVAFTLTAAQTQSGVSEVVEPGDMLIVTTEGTIKVSVIQNNISNAVSNDTDATVTSGRVVVMDGTTGKKVKQSDVLISDIKTLTDNSNAIGTIATYPVSGSIQDMLKKFRGNNSFLNNKQDKAIYAFSNPYTIQIDYKNGNFTDYELLARVAQGLTMNYEAGVRCVSVFLGSEFGDAAGETAIAHLSNYSKTNSSEPGYYDYEVDYSFETLKVRFKGRLSYNDEADDRSSHTVLQYDVIEYME